MSAQYDLYLQQHRNNVYKGFRWIQENLPELLVDGVAWQTEFAHDTSKNEPDEYEAYDRYFYGNNKSYQVVQEYRRAWLLHIHRNPHHWQHWVLINDDPKEGEIAWESCWWFQTRLTVSPSCCLKAFLRIILVFFRDGTKLVYDYMEQRGRLITA